MTIMGNSKKSEQAAVKALFEYFIDSKRVDCNIPTNDKGLLWDDSLHFFILLNLSVLKISLLVSQFK